MTNTKKEIINEAIYKVITTQYKKDAKEAHEIVKAAGYEIYKYDGHYRVSSRETGKEAYIGWNYYHGYRICLRGTTKMFENNEPCPVDFVNYLETPINRDYISLTYKRTDRYSAAVGRYKQIRWERKSAKDYNDKIEEIKKKIADLNESIVYYARAQLKAEQRADELKKEFGLA